MDGFFSLALLVLRFEYRKYRCHARTDRSCCPLMSQKIRGQDFGSESNACLSTVRSLRGVEA